MVRIQIHGSGPLTRAQLIGVRKGIFQHLHHRYHAAGLVFNQFDRRAGFAQVGQQKRHTAAALRELQRRVHTAPDGFHIIFNAQQEAGNKLPALLFAAVEERRSGGLKTSADDLFQQMFCQFRISPCQRQRHHADAIFKPLQITLAVKGFQGIAGIIFQGTEESRKAEFFTVRLPEQIFNKFKIILSDNISFVIVFINQKIEFFPQIMEKHGVLINMLAEVVVCGRHIFIKLDFSLCIIQIEHGIQGVVIRVFSGHRVIPVSDKQHSAGGFSGLLLPEMV